MRKLSIMILIFVMGQLGYSLAVADSDESRANRVAAIKQLKVKDILVYKPEKPKASVVVFTDANCSYCHKLHLDIPKLMELGIELKILAYPRQGVGSRSYNTMVAVWCSRDRKEAMTHAMEGESVGMLTCTNPIKEHYLMARKMGVPGTPTLIFEDGTLSAGYLSPSSLARLAIKHSVKQEKSE